MPGSPVRLTRRRLLAAASAAAAAGAAGSRAAAPAAKAQIAITLDLEMSRHYPQRGMLEWDYRKGDLDAATREYSVAAAERAHRLGGKIHFFCVGRVLEQPDVGWLQRIAAQGHPIGNHTYDHVNVLARDADQVQYRFQRAPWLTRGRAVDEVIRDNIAMTSEAMQQRAGLAVNGFRTPGGFHQGLAGREDLQQMLRELGFTWVSSKYPPHAYQPVDFRVLGHAPVVGDVSRCGELRGRDLMIGDSELPQETF